MGTFEDVCSLRIDEARLRTRVRCWRRVDRRIRVSSSRVGVVFVYLSGHQRRVRDSHIEKCISMTDALHQSPCVLISLSLGVVLDLSCVVSASRFFGGEALGPVGTLRKPSLAASMKEHEQLSSNCALKNTVT